MDLKMYELVHRLQEKAKIIGIGDMQLSEWGKLENNHTPYSQLECSICDGSCIMNSDTRPCQGGCIMCSSF